MGYAVGFERLVGFINSQLPANFLPEHPFDHGNLRGRDELLMAFPRTASEVRGELACYYAVISHLDRQVGRILEALRAAGQADNTLAIFTSDNGLAIGSHGLRGKQNMYEHLIGVPLIIRGPAVVRGRRTDAQCYLRDLFPTACDVAGIPVPQSVRGRTLLPVLYRENRVDSSGGLRPLRQRATHDSHGPVEVDLVPEDQPRAVVRCIDRVRRA